MSTKHTTGEGVVVQNPDSCNESNAASIYWGDTYVADVYRNYVGSELVGKEEQLANARLIAAAPDLLAVCIDLMQHASLTEHMSAASVERARAAISKATGEQA